MHLDLVLIYFVYGLGFFTMGLAMVLEAGRSSYLANANLLIPLAGFGLLHGLHEWLEIFLLQLVWLNIFIPDWIATLRLVLLAISFILLLYYGISSNLKLKPLTLKVVIPAGILLLIYLVIISFNAIQAIQTGASPGLKITDALIRYLLAVVGGILASLGLIGQARSLKTSGKVLLSNSLLLAATGFGIYGLTQIFVPAVNMFPARWINSDTFLATVGFPIQVVRAMTAVIVMVAVLRSSNLLEKERQQQLATVQTERMEALERIQEELSLRENLRRDHLRHIVHAQEDERARIARELHDETSQALSAFTLELAALKQLRIRRKEISSLVDRLQSLSRQMSLGLFRLVHDLRPAQLDDLGLASALRYLAEKGNCPPGLTVSLEVNGPERRLDPVLETVLFRVAQEALSNISRHAQVDTASMKLVYSENQVTLWIEDQGIGFDPGKKYSPPRGWGLAGMRERIESANGTLTILSHPGKGTIIEAVIPV